MSAQIQTKEKSTMHDYRYYKASKTATVLYWVRYIFYASGLGNVPGQHPLLGLVTIFIGLLLAILAEENVEKTLMHNWKQGLDNERIRSDIVEAVQAYNDNPCRLSLNYIRALNPAAADYICQNTGKKKK